MTEFESALITLLTVVFSCGSTLIAVHLSNKSNHVRQRNLLEHEKEKEDKDRNRKYLEDLYGLVDKWLSVFTFRYLFLVQVMEGQMTHDEYLDEVIKDSEKKNFRLVRLEMFVEMYFPEKFPEYNTMVQLREEMNDVISAHKQSYLSGQNGERFLKPCFEVHMKILEAGKQFKKQIAAYSQTI